MLIREFVVNCLKKLQIPSNLVNVISHSISSTTLQLLWNGNKEETFTTSHGIDRQGDPILPHLFVICLGKLANLIQEKLMEGT